MCFNIPQSSKLCLICFVIHSGTFLHVPSVSHALESDLLTNDQPKPDHDLGHHLPDIQEHHFHDHENNLTDIHDHENNLTVIHEQHDHEHNHNDIHEHHDHGHENSLSDINEQHDHESNKTDIHDHEHSLTDSHDHEHSLTDIHDHEHSLTDSHEQHDHDHENNQTDIHEHSHHDHRLTDSHKHHDHDHDHEHGLPDSHEQHDHKNNLTDLDEHSHHDQEHHLTDSHEHHDHDHEHEHHDHEHEHHDHEHGLPDIQQHHVINYKILENYYLKKLFKEYGNGKDVLTLDGLVLLFEKLGFKELPDIHDHSDHSHDTDETDKHLHESDKHLHESDYHKHTKDHDHVIHKESLGNEVGKRSTASTSQLQKIKRAINHDSADHDHSYHSHEECTAIYKQYDIIHKTEYTSERFLSICPAIIYMLQKSTCMGKPHHHPHQEKQSGIGNKSSARVWGLSILAIFIISLVGLTGVAIIPIMQKVFYNHLLQFLVALAVGALSGDALLHLLPHGLEEGVHDHSDHSADHSDDHTTSVYKGLCGLLGIYFFFFMERVLTIVTDLKRKRKNEKSVKGRDDNMEIVIPLAQQCAQMRVEDSNCHDQIMGIHPGQKALTNYAETTQIRCLEAHDSHEKEFDESEDPTSVLSHTHHGHSHHLPNSVSAIAWMVILGDGIHNFSDGLAIGAAFANSITVGVSTTVAVFCHELPHEIGDFAVLLRAGMSWKQAVMYNCVSSFLALLGAIVGICIGNIGHASQWIFVCIAGMFLYIALVDMLPELTSVDTKKGENPFHHLFLQLLGMLLGASIMLLIAVYEKDMQMMLD